MPGSGETTDGGVIGPDAEGIFSALVSEPDIGVAVISSSQQIVFINRWASRFYLDREPDGVVGQTTDVLFGGIESPSMLYRWRKDDPDNPFFAFLGLADHVIVTADSVSMMAEACATGRPVYLFDTGEGRTSMKHNPWLDGVDETSQSGDNTTDNSRGDGESGAVGLNRWHLKAHVYRLTMRLGPKRLTRDIRIVQQLLVDTDRAVWLGDGRPSNPSRPLDDVSRAVERVRQLFESLRLTHSKAVSIIACATRNFTVGRGSVRIRDPRLDRSNQALVEVSPTAWFSFFGAPPALRHTPFPSQRLEELHL